MNGQQHLDRYLRRLRSATPELLDQHVWVDWEETPYHGCFEGHLLERTLMTYDYRPPYNIKKGDKKCFCTFQNVSSNGVSK